MTEGTLNESIQPGEDGKSRVEGYTKFEYVRSGYIYRNGLPIERIDGSVRNGPKGYLFYKGSNPSQALPMGKVGYKGTWDYVTDAKMGQKFSQLGNSQAGDRYGALSAEEADVLRNKSEAPRSRSPPRRSRHRQPNGNRHALRHSGQTRRPNPRHEIRHPKRRTQLRQNRHLHAQTHHGRQRQRYARPPIHLERRSKPVRRRRLPA